MARLVSRTNAENVSQGNGSGASTLPALVIAEPCPCVPWHCQQPYLMKPALPFAASPAANAEPDARATAPAAAAASATRTIVRVICLCSRSARLRPDVDESRLAGLHGRHCFLDRGSDLLRILDRALGPPAERLRELVVLDVGIHDAGADRTHVVAEARDAISAARQPLHQPQFLMIT